MTLPRTLTLTLGPLLAIGLCYAIAAPVRQAAVPIAAPAASPARPDPMELGRRCDQAVEQLRRTSPASWTIRIAPPYLFAGDLTADELDALYHEMVVPTARALQIDYFDHEPDRPITVLILSSEESYRTAMQSIGRTQQAEYSGLYYREERTILLNLSTGAGTLAHELTHALAHADYPQLPEWFDEGLASLHEESEFTADGLHLRGRHNWRRRFLAEAEERGRWKSLSQLLEQPFAEPDVAALDYALARYFCLFLQDRGLLPAYYRKLRTFSPDDDAGSQALHKLFPGRTLDEVDLEFRTWFRTRN